MLPHSCVNSGRGQLFPSKSGCGSWEAWHPQLFITSPPHWDVWVSSNSATMADLVACSEGHWNLPSLQMVAKRRHLHLKAICVRVLPILISSFLATWTDHFPLRARQCNSLSISKWWPSESSMCTQMILFCARHLSWPTFMCCSLPQLL